MKEVYSELSNTLKDLEKAQEDLLVEVPEDQIETELAYLDAPAVLLSEMDLRVSTAAQTERQSQVAAQTEADATLKKQEFTAAQASFRTKLEGFGKPSANLSLLSSEKNISYADMRLEIKKLENSQAKLVEERVKLVNMDPTADLSAFIDMFNNMVVVEVDNCKRIALEYLKEDVSTTSATSEVLSTGRGRGSGITFSSTKRETVILPKFSGEEKTAYLKYPVWKEQWNSHITEYEVKYRSTMLLNHLDSKALDQIIGLENDYEKAMQQLDRYYNDAKKIVKSCLDEIRTQSTISAFDYKALVAYKKCLASSTTTPGSRRVTSSTRCPIRRLCLFLSESCRYKRL